MKLTYTKIGDYFIPNLIMPEEKRPIGKYGNLRKKYLKEYHKGIYEGMLLSCKLWEHLADVEEQATQRMDTLIEQMKKAEGGGNRRTKGCRSDEMGAGNEWYHSQGRGNHFSRADIYFIVLNGGLAIG